MNSISKIIEQRNASLLPNDYCVDVSHKRFHLTSRLAASYQLFEQIRYALFTNTTMPSGAVVSALLRTMEEHSIVNHDGHSWRPSSASARKYLSGGWFEEYLSHAISAAGADEVLCGQRLSWVYNGYHGENEIDVLARFSETIVICSCKALKHSLKNTDASMRSRLMDALNEVDNLADHFAPANSIVILAVTTDLIDEARKRVRYSQLHGKAAALKVVLLSYEHMHWGSLTRKIQQLISQSTT